MNDNHINSIERQLEYIRKHEDPKGSGYIAPIAEILKNLAHQEGVISAILQLIHDGYKDTTMVGLLLKHAPDKKNVVPTAIQLMWDSHAGGGSNNAPYIAKRLIKYASDKDGVMPAVLELMHNTEKEVPDIDKYKIAKYLIWYASGKDGAIPTVLNLMHALHQKDNFYHASRITKYLLEHAADKDDVASTIIQYPQNFHGDQIIQLAKAAFQDAAKNSFTEKFKAGFITEKFAVSIAAPVAKGKILISNRHTLIFDNDGETMVANEHFWGTIENFEKHVSEKCDGRTKKGRHYTGVIGLAHRFDKQKTPRPV